MHNARAQGHAETYHHRLSISLKVRYICMHSVKILRTRCLCANVWTSVYNLWWKNYADERFNRSTNHTLCIPFAHSELALFRKSFDKVLWMCSERASELLFSFHLHNFRSRHALIHNFISSIFFHVLQKKWNKWRPTRKCYFHALPAS